MRWSIPPASARSRWRGASRAIRPTSAAAGAGQGQLFRLSPGRPVFSRLIYPTPVDGGLGVHVTLDLAGRMRFGPDVEWIEQESYTVDPRRARSFYDRIRAYWPGLPADSLVPDYCGIRPKLTGPGEPAADFMIARAGAARPAAAGQPVRDRIAGADLVAVARRRRGRLSVKLTAQIGDRRQIARWP